MSILIDLPTLLNQSGHNILIPIMLPTGNVSFIFIYDVNSESYKVFNLTHPDLPISGDGVDLSSIPGQLINIFDQSNPIAAATHVTIGKVFRVEDYLIELKQFIFNNLQDIHIIPMSRWIGMLTKIVKKYLATIAKMNSDDIFAVKMYNDLVNPVVRTMNGHTVKVGNEFIPNRYVPYTMTGRPTNVNKINFLAIPHTSPIRTEITSRFTNGMLIEYDFKSYHPMLLLKCIISQGEFLEYQTDFYHKISAWVERKTGRVYDGVHIKRMVMQTLNSMDDSILSTHPIFAAVNGFKQELMSEYQRLGYIRSIMFKRRIYPPNRADMNGGILLSYIFQSLESERNYVILNDIFKYLYQKGSLFLLYVYDSFLIDYNPTDGQSIFYELMDIIGQGEFPVTFKVGHDYSSMMPTNFLGAHG